MRRQDCNLQFFKIFPVVQNKVLHGGIFYLIVKYSVKEVVTMLNIVVTTGAY